MGKIFYISDLHLGHDNCIAFDNRPFSDSRNMEERIIENWNKVVSDNDKVYVLGDTFWNYKWEDANAIVCQLNGDFHEIAGNHDDKLRTDLTKDYEQIEDNGRHVVLCHYPIMFYRNMTRNNWYHLYGHVHAAWDHNMVENWRKQIEALYLTEWKGYNVGCMMPYMNYTPRTLNEIIEGARTMRGLT